MKKSWVIALLMSAFLVATSSARIWMDTRNRKIEAELLRVEGDKAVLKFRGREVKFPISKLCDDDQDYIKEWQEEQEEDEDAGSSDVGGISVCGTTLKLGGAVTTVEEDVNTKVLKAYSRAPIKPTKIKIAIALPEGFDPNKPQRVMWVSAPINNENERKSGNTGAIGMYTNTATSAGWVTIAVDLDIGNPRRAESEHCERGDLATHTQAIEALTAAWPEFKTWKFACCGISGGAKASFFRVGHLLVNKLHVIGLYLSGCNQDFTDRARKETRCRKSGLRKIKVWISNGKSDDVSTVDHAESLERSLKSNRFGKIRLELFEGGHVLDQNEFKKAIEWFTEPK